MLYVRVIPVLLLRDGRMVKTRQFGATRDVGDPVTAARVYDAQGADELMFLDIDASSENRDTLYDVIKRVSQECFMPLTVGGGVRTLEDVRRLLSVGADKVSINSAAVENTEFVAKAAEVFGDQCIVGSVDARNINGKYEVFTHGGKRPTGLDAFSYARCLMQCHVGEVLVTSIDREGTMEGYNLSLTGGVAEAVSVPVIANGGCGKLHHCVEAISTAGASAVAAASIFHFTDQSPIKAHSYMKNAGINVRTIYA